ncbi:PH domain-containing protein [Streptomyces xanthophaeus]
MLLFIVGGVFALIGAGLLISGPGAGISGMVFGPVAVSAGGWIVFRSCVMGVRIDSAGLTERGLGRSQVVPWCEISAVDTGDGPGIAPVQAPELVLKNGKQVGLGALASYSSRVIDADFAYIKSMHATHVTDCPNCA